MLIADVPLRSAKLSLLVLCFAFVRPHVAGATVTPGNLTFQVLIPAAASAPGANGTFFRSEISIVNFRHSDQRVRLQWLPQSGGSPKVTDITVGPRATITSNDFVKNILNIEGLGSLLITGINSEGTTDADALLWVTSRVWTPDPGGTGSVSQSMDPVSPPALNFGGGAIFGSRRDDQHRVNVGIVNLDSQIQVFVFEVQRPGEHPLAEVYGFGVPPMSMQQVTLSRSTSPIEYIRVFGKPGTWFAYSSSINNVTGGASTEFPVEVIP